MAENIMINLTQELEDDVKGRYETMCDDLSDSIRTLRDGLDKICTDTHYEPIVNVANNTIRIFNEDIRAEASNIIEAWMNGDSCYSAAARNQQSGSDAESTGRAIDTEIQERFNRFWNGYPMGEEMQIDTSRPKIKDEDFEELQEIYDKSFEAIEDISESISTEIDGQADDDAAYALVKPPITALTETLKAAFEKFREKVSEAKEMANQIKTAQDSKNEEAIQTAQNMAGVAAAPVEALAMFSDI